MPDSETGGRRESTLRSIIPLPKRIKGTLRIMGDTLQHRPTVKREQSTRGTVTRPSATISSATARVSAAS